jgi:hypothetical protein
VQEFAVDLKNIQWDRHFGPEIGFNPFALLTPRWWKWQRERLAVSTSDLIRAAHSKQWVYAYPESAERTGA